MLRTIEQLRKDAPDRQVFVLAGMILLISNDMAADLVRENVVYLCGCGCYHLNMQLRPWVEAGQASLDLSGLEPLDAKNANEITPAVAELIRKATASTGHDTRPAPPPVKPTPPPAPEPIASAAAVRVNVKDAIETRQAIRKADWYKKTIVPIAFKTPYWRLQRTDVYNSEGWVEEWKAWLTMPDGTIDEDAHDLPANTVWIDIKRLNDLDGAAPLRAIAGKHRAFLALYRFVSGYYHQELP